MSLIVAEFTENTSPEDRITVINRVKKVLEDYAMQDFFQVRHNFSRISIQGKGGRTTAQASSDFERALQIGGVSDTTEDYVRDMTRELQRDVTIRGMIEPSQEEVERRIAEDLEEKEQEIDADVVPELSPLPRTPLSSIAPTNTPETAGSRLGRALRAIQLGDVTSDDESETSTISYESSDETDDASSFADANDDGEFKPYDTEENSSYTVSETFDELQREIDAAEESYVMDVAETEKQRKIARELAAAIATTSAFSSEDVVDSNGQPRPVSELMRMARVTSLWPVLSELQKAQFRDTPGVLANDRHYIAQNVTLAAPIKKKRPFVQTVSGNLLYA